MTEDDIKQLAQTIGKAIARHREASKLTQEEVAEKLRIGNEAVSRMRTWYWLLPLMKPSPGLNLIRSRMSALLLGTRKN